MGTIAAISAEWMNKSTEKWILLAIVALHLALTLPAAYYLNIWVDEASSLYATEQGFWVAFQNAAAEQKQAPLYFWILSLWRSIDGSIFFARLFSIICSVIAISLFAGLASKVADRPRAVLLTAFFGLHPFLVWASVEIRVYSLVILLSIILLRTFLNAFWNEEERTKYAEIWFLLTVVVALYTNYYLGFLIAGLFAALVFSGRWREVGRFALLMTAAGVAFVPMVFQMLAELNSKTSGFQEVRTVTEGVRILWHHFLTFVFPTEIFPGPEQTMASYFRLWIMRAAVLLTIVTIIWKRKNLTSLTLSFGVITFVVGLFLLIAYLLVGGVYIHIRHASVLFVPLLLLLGSLAADLSGVLSEARKKALIIAGAVFVIPVFAYAYSAIYPNMTKRGDWARVAEFIESNESPNEPIVTFEAFDALALPYYYRGGNRILPDENYFDFGLQGPPGSPESLVRQNNFVISEIPAGTSTLWLVVNESCISTEACRPLENYVESNYTIDIEKEFYLVKVYRLKARSK